MVHSSALFRTLGFLTPLAFFECISSRKQHQLEGSISLWSKVLKKPDSEALNGGNNRLRTGPAVNVCDWSEGLWLIAQPLGFKELINCWKSKDITAATVPVGQ